MENTDGLQAEQSFASSLSSQAFCSQLEEAQNGDLNELNELMLKWRPFLRAYARKLMGGPIGTRVDSSDLVQETMLHVYRQIKQFRGKSRREWAGWIKAILVNEAKRSNRLHRAEMRDVAQSVHADCNNLGARGDDAQRGLEQMENTARVLVALEKLEDPMRDVIIRRIFKDQPFSEVAKGISKSEGAARVIWTRGLKKLQRILVDLNVEN